MADRSADWPAGVGDFPEVREQLAALVDGAARGDLERACQAFEHLLALADRRPMGPVNHAARSALLRLAARYPPNEVLAARHAKGSRPMDADERSSIIIALLIAVMMGRPTPKASV